MMARVIPTVMEATTLMVATMMLVALARNLVTLT